MDHIYIHIEIMKNLSKILDFIRDFHIIMIIFHLIVKILCLETYLYIYFQIFLLNNYNLILGSDFFLVGFIFTISSDQENF
jgi:hypothetical protein